MTTQTTPLATQPKDMTRFYLRKGRIMDRLGGIQTMQKRDDVSGKFARKLTQIGRSLRTVLEGIQEEDKALQELHKDKFPVGHPQAGEVKPVYASDETGKPVYKKDATGNDTTEREVIPGQFLFADPVKYNTDRMDMMKEFVVVECPCFRVTDPDGKDDKFVPELDRFPKVNGAAWDACAEFEEGSPATTPPTEWASEEVKDAIAEGDVVATEARTAP